MLQIEQVVLTNLELVGRYWIRYWLVRLVGRPISVRERSRRNGKFGCRLVDVGSANERRDDSMCFPTAICGLLDWSRPKVERAFRHAFALALGAFT